MAMLSPQQREILKQLALFPIPVPAPVIGGKIVIKHSSLSTNLWKLGKDKLVSHSEDGWKITKEGRDLLKKEEEALVKREDVSNRELFDVFSSFVDIFDRLAVDGILEIKTTTGTGKVKKLDIHFEAQ
jgi:hypothetical protein